MMVNHKVYLSKSNRACPDHVMVVRRHLEFLGYEIIEHHGGDYDESLLYQCRYMVMVGIECPSIGNHGIVKIGKGQYNQLKNRKDRSTNYYTLYFTHTNERDEPVYRSVRLDGVIDPDNWTTGYGKLQVKMNTVRRLPGVAREPIARKPIRPEEVEIDDDVDLTDPRTRAKHLACITLLTNT